MGEAKSKEVSAFGSRKWRDFRRGGQDVPADLGGIHVCVDEDGFRRMQEVCSNLGLRPPSEMISDKEGTEEKGVFQKLLQAPDEQNEAMIRELIGAATHL